MRKREIKLSVYLNDDEWKMLTLKAEKVGYNKSALVRSLIEGFKLKEKPSDEFYEDLNSIRKVGNILSNCKKSTLSRIYWRWKIFKKNGKWITKSYIEYKEKIFVAREKIKYDKSVEFCKKENSTDYLQYVEKIVNLW